MAFLTIGATRSALAQCGYAAGLGCANTDYNNFGYNSHNNPATIEYDNYVSGYHQTIARTFSGDFQIWGHYTAADGTASVLSPQGVNSTNYPGLTGIVLKAAIGSNGYSHQQTIILTTAGLFAMGSFGTVLSTDVKNDRPLSKLTINGRANGLPLGVEPADVKMLVATYQTLALLTCSGEVWVISQTSAMRGNGSGGNAKGWYRVLTSTTGSIRLSSVVAIRAGTAAMMALLSDGTIWAWGTHTYIGDGSSGAKRTVATQMSAPKAGTIKMIGVTTDKKYAAFYALYTDGALYSLGDNAKRQLGDWTTTERTTWVQPRYHSPSGPVMNNIRWISAMEHDWKYPAADVINEDMNLYNWGAEEGHSLGRGNMNETPVDPGMPLGLSASDQILSVEAGGHTTMFTERCQQNFGYVGHRIFGSMGNGSTVNTYESVINYNTAYVPICGAMNTPVIGVWVIEANGDVCNGATILLDPSPGGGALSVVSGPGIIHGNELTFTGEGEVTIQYVVSADCGLKTITRSFSVTGCLLYKIRGMVWIDTNEDAIRDAGEIGTNAGSRLTDGVWANLVGSDGKVIQSMPVNLNGTYELYTRNSGNYTVRITNEQIGEGVAIAAPSRILPGEWKYTGHNDGLPCVVPSCVNPDIISGVILNPANREVNDLDFGLITPKILPIQFKNFQAYKDGDGVTLRWAAAEESPGAGFEIFRSSDGINWAIIGYLPAGNGSAGVERNYKFKDDAPVQGINYYRLKHVDANKKFVFSHTAAIRLAVGSNVVTVFPNPTHNIVKLTGITGSEIIRVFDNTGKQVLKYVAKLQEERVDLSKFPTGFYLIIIQGSDGSTQPFKILKRD